MLLFFRLIDYKVVLFGLGLIFCNIIVSHLKLLFWRQKPCQLVLLPQGVVRSRVWLQGEWELPLWILSQLRSCCGRNDVLGFVGFFSPLWIYSSKRRNMFPWTGKNFFPLNLHFCFCFKFPAEFALWNLLINVKKPQSSNLTKFHPAQMPGAGVCWCLSLPVGDLAEILSYSDLSRSLCESWWMFWFIVL